MNFFSLFFAFAIVSFLPCFSRSHYHTPPKETSRCWEPQALTTGGTRNKCHRESLGALHDPQHRSVTARNHTFIPRRYLNIPSSSVFCQSFCYLVVFSTIPHYLLMGLLCRFDRQCSNVPYTPIISGSDQASYRPTFNRRAVLLHLTCLHPL